MVLEYIAIGLGVLTGVAAAIAYIYRRGISQGIDTACGKRIEKKLNDLKTDGDKVHKELKDEIHEINGKVDKLTGAFETIKEFIKK